MKRLWLVLAAVLFAAPAFANTVMITGSNRGLGLEFTKQYAEKGYDVIATTRNPDDAKDLKALAAKHKGIMIEKLDVLDHAAVKALAAKYKGKPVDILINNAGVLGEGTFGTLDLAMFHKVMDTNVFATMAVSEAFKDNIAASKEKKIIFISSPAGTFNIQSLFKDGKMAGLPAEGTGASPKDRHVDVSGGGGFYYSLSKVAVNMAVQKIRPALKKDGITVGIIAPNAVDTDMLAELGFGGAAMKAPEAIGKFIKIIDSMNVQNQGKPIVQDGTVLDW
jgi:NAD(P)-dependent dehydrogenase (short-subunit alcohol dehydrogenase family)